MGNRGTPPALVVSGGGYWMAQPPVTRERLAKILGAPIADDVWREVEEAFRNHQTLVEHTTQAVRAADYRKGRSKAERDIDAALKAAMAHAWSETTRSMESMARWSRGGIAGTLDCDIGDHLSEAARHLGTALNAIRRAEPVAMNIPTLPDAKVSLVQRLHGILLRAGLPTALSSRGGPPVELTPFERLVREIGVHSANSEDALVAWIGAATQKT